MDTAEFFKWVPALIGAEGPSMLAKADEWFTTFRKKGLQAWKTCIDILNRHEPSLSDKIVASQTVVWFCKKGNFVIEFSDLTPCIARVSDPSYKPVLNQLCLATAIFFCRHAISNSIGIDPLASSNRGSILTQFLNSYGHAFSSSQIVAVLSSIPDQLISREVKLRILPGQSRTLAASIVYKENCTVLVGLLDGCLAVSKTRPNVSGIEVKELLQCASTWLDIIPELSPCRPHANAGSPLSANDMTVQQCLSICIDAWLSSQTICFVVTALMEDEEIYFRSSCDVCFVSKSLTFAS